MERKASEPSQGLPRAMSSRDGLLLDEEEEEGMDHQSGSAVNTHNELVLLLIAISKCLTRSNLSKGLSGLAGLGI